MNSRDFSFLITTLAGLSTLIGFLFIFIKASREKIIGKALGFASGVMITISVIDLLPGALDLLLKSNSFLIALILIFIGIFIGAISSNIIDKKVDSITNERLYNLGLITALVIMLHNIPEGIATFITASSDNKLGLVLAISIALHNIPEGISISLPIYYATKSKTKAFVYTLVSGLAEPLGAIICYLFLSKYITNDILAILYAVIAGMIINICINELYKEAYEFSKKDTIIFFFIGIIVMVINHLIF